MERGRYKCAGHKRRAHLVDASIPPEKGKKRVNNIYVDHIIPVIDPVVGFTSWDSVIERLFCERDNLQILCKACHDLKTKEEKEQAKHARRNEE